MWRPSFLLAFLEFQSSLFWASVKRTSLLFIPTFCVCKDASSWAEPFLEAIIDFRRADLAIPSIQVGKTPI